MSGTIEIERNAQKAGRTLLVNDREKNIDVSQYIGLVSSFKTSSESLFMEFNTIESASSAFEALRENNVRVKYAYYKLFIKITSELDKLTYDQIKDAVRGSIDANILYFKLYKKDDRLLGSGDFTIDRLGDLNNLIKKSFELEIKGIPLKFDIFRFRIKKPVTV